MKILVISGFLGAGKTTFIRELARRTHRDFAIMENEYGDVGIDGGLLAEGKPAEKLNIWELTEGCICCSMKSDFATSVLTIANTVDPEFLIVEPTGVGMLSRVLENLSLIQYDRIQLLSPVTLADGHSIDRYLGEFPDICRDQLAAAGTILVSKMEGADECELDAIGKKLASLAPEAEIFTRHYSRNPDEWWEGLLRQPLKGTPFPPSGDEDSGLENLGLTDISLDSAPQLVLFLQGVVSGVFGDICRAKGCLKAGESWLRFDVADRVYSVTGCDETEQSKAVFIGKELRRSDLREVLMQELIIASPRIRSRAGRKHAFTDPVQ